VDSLKRDYERCVAILEPLEDFCYHAGVRLKEISDDPLLAEWVPPKSNR
jgi:hypothetical protein